MCMATITMTLEHYNAIVDELLNGLKSSEKEIAKELSALKTKKCCHFKSHPNECNYLLIHM